MPAEELLNRLLLGLDLRVQFRGYSLIFLELDHEFLLDALSSIPSFLLFLLLHNLLHLALARLTL